MPTTEPVRAHFQPAAASRLPISIRRRISLVVVGPSDRACGCGVVELPLLVATVGWSTDEPGHRDCSAVIRLDSPQVAPAHPSTLSSRAADPKTIVVLLLLLCWMAVSRVVQRRNHARLQARAMGTATTTATATATARPNAPPHRERCTTTRTAPGAVITTRQSRCCRTAVGCVVVIGDAALHCAREWGFVSSSW